MTTFYNQQTIKSIQTHYKLVLVGDSGCGKTTLIERLRTGQFLNDYQPTLEIKFQELPFLTNSGMMAFDIVDCNGSLKAEDKGLRQSQYMVADGILLFFDLTSKLSYDHLDYWLNEIRDKTQCPIILCATKSDSTHKIIKPKQITFHINHSLTLYEISAKSNHNFEKPFLHLLRDLSLNSNLEFVK